MSADAGGAYSNNEGWWPFESTKKKFAQSLETALKHYEHNVSSRKQHLFAKLNSTDNSLRFLDVGIGTGPNLKYLPPGSSCVGLEPNKYMWYVQK